VTLDRLQEKGFLTSKMGEPTSERGGRRKRYYQITGKGRRALTQAWAQAEKTFADLDWLQPKPAGA
jgi:DNA-binding PadR family transcriptional regulator